MLLPLLPWAGGGRWGAWGTGQGGHRSGRQAFRTLAADRGRRVAASCSGGGLGWTPKEEARPGRRMTRWLGLGRGMKVLHGGTKS